MNEARRIQVDIPTLIYDNRRKTDAMLKKFMEEGRCVFGKCFDIERNNE